MRGSSITLEDYPLEEAMRIFRDAGYTSVEMWVHHLKKSRTDELRRKFAAHAKGMGIGMGGLNVVGEDYYQPFGSDDQLERTLAGLKSDVDFAQSLGAKDVLIWEGRAPSGASEAHWMERLLHWLKSKNWLSNFPLESLPTRASKPQPRQR